MVEDKMKEHKDSRFNRLTRILPLRRRVGVGLLWSAWLLVLPHQAEAFLWTYSLTEARASALSQGKLILLMAGRPDCPYCNYMQTQVLEAPNVRLLIDEIYVPWYANIDVATDYRPYAAGLGTFSLPLNCMIDPRTTNAWLLRKTGAYAADTFEGFLKEAARLAPPRPTNLTDLQVVSDARYQVAGHIWAHAQPTGVFYRVNLGSHPVNPFTSASGTTDWIAPLAPFVVAGVSNQYTFDVYARFTNGATSLTNRLIFSYSPSVLPRPRIQVIRVAQGVVQLTLTNLTAGVTQRVERSLALDHTNAWTSVTNFVSTGSGCAIAECAGPSCSRAFYRVVSSP
jgi:hypothetical protein